MDIQLIIDKVVDLIAGWPLIICVIAVSILCTVAFRFIQVTYFFTSIKANLFPEAGKAKADMTPFQAFVNSLSASLGNGSLGGIAVAIALGGPGALFWVVVIGFLLMSVRFAEIYLTTYFGPRMIGGSYLGGPMVYLQHVIAGKQLAYIYAFFCLWFGLICGSSLQSNTVALSLTTAWGIPALVNATLITAFVAYVFLGGAARIVKVSEMIVPVKVIVFFTAAFIILGYHYQAIIPAFRLMFWSAFNSGAFAGGVIGFAVREAMREGISKVIFATEAGLGTAAIVYGGAKSEQPVVDSIASMLSVFISMVVCFLVGLCIIVSGTWDSGLKSTELTVAAFNTVFGSYGGWVVSFLSASFGLGVTVVFAYVTRAVWLYVTGGRWQYIFSILYCVFAFIGALISVPTIWQLAGITSILLLLLNLFAIVMLFPLILKGLAAYRNEQKKRA